MPSHSSFYPGQFVGQAHRDPRASDPPTSTRIKVCTTNTYLILHVLATLKYISYSFLNIQEKWGGAQERCSVVKGITAFPEDQNSVLSTHVSSSQLPIIQLQGI